MIDIFLTRIFHFLKVFCLGLQPPGIRSKEIIAIPVIGIMNWKPTRRIQTMNSPEWPVTATICGGMMLT